MVEINITLDDALFGQFLQAVRDFEQEHQEHHFDIKAVATDMVDSQVEAILRSIKPAFDFFEKHRKQ